MSDKLLMSDELVGRIDESSLSGEFTIHESPSILIMMAHGMIEGDFVRVEWDGKGKLKKAITRIGVEDIQKVVEGIKVSSVGFRLSKDAKTVWMTKDSFISANYEVDVIDDATFLSVTVHYSLDT